MSDTTVWVEHVSRSTGLKYWFNSKTGESRYDSPLHLAPKVAAVIENVTTMSTRAPTSETPSAEAWYSANATADRGLAARQVSNVLHLRSLNNWIKSTLIRECAPQPCTSVLDLACGKLGDIFKWQAAGIKKYCGIDIARGALEKGSERFNSVAASSGLVGKLPQADLGSVALSASGFLAAAESFDCISIQFGLATFFGA